MPETPLIASSIGSIDRRRHLVRARAGQRQRHVDGRRIGLREQIDAEVAEREDAEHDQRHHEHRGEDRPADAEFREHAGYLPAIAGRRVTFMPSASLSTSVIATRLAGLDAADDLDAIAEPLADLQLAHRQLVAVDDEHAVDAVAVLQRGVRQRQHVVDLAALDVDARERAGLQRGVACSGTSASNGNARVAVLTAGLMRDTLPVNVRVADRRRRAARPAGRP